MKISINNTQSSSDLYYLGMEQLGDKCYDSALKYFCESFDRHAHFKTAQRIAEALIELNRDEEADLYIETAYQLNSTNSQCAVMYAHVLLRKGDKEKAQAILEDVLKRNNSYGPALRLLKELS